MYNVAATTSKKNIISLLRNLILFSILSNSLYLIFQLSCIPSFVIYIFFKFFYTGVL